MTRMPMTIMACHCVSSDRKGRYLLTRHRCAVCQQEESR